MATNSYEMSESSSDGVDIKHEPLEPDVEDYVSIPAGVMEALDAEVVQATTAWKSACN